LQEEKEGAKTHLEQVRQLIKYTGYHRRDSALKELQEHV